MAFVVGGGDGKTQKLDPLRIKVILMNNFILITNEESGLIWKSYSVRHKTCRLQQVRESV